MAASDHVQSGTCLDPAHNTRWLVYVDSLESRIAALEALTGSDGVPEIPAAKYSTLGLVIGGASAAAGSIEPAIAGEVIPQPGATTWIKITGTAAQVGDAVYMIYEGRRTASPTNPAARIFSSAGPGAPGANVLAAGEIEITLSGSNTDNNKVFWFLNRKAS